MDHPIQAGWKEYADFPGWGLRRVKVKLDTGARSATIGARSFEVFKKADGFEVEMQVAPYRKDPNRVATIRIPVVGFIRVRSTAGIAEERPMVEVVIRLGGVTKRICATVADRSRMLVPVLLGRIALAPEFVVDPAQKFLLPRRSRRKRGDKARDEK